MRTQTSNQNYRVRRWAGRLLQIVLVMMILIISIWLVGGYAKKSLMDRYPVPGQMIDVGGLKMHIHCMGEGSPTVILVGGLDDFSITWSLVQPEVAKTTRVCSYDRAGLGWSEVSPSPRTSANMVKELHTLLVEAKVEAPYVMVGHSFGGTLTQIYVHDYPAEVAGLVLVDATPTELFERIPVWSKAIEQKIGMFRVLEPLSSFGLFALAPNKIPNRGFPEEALAQYRAISSATDYYKTCIAENEMFEKNLSEIESAQIISLEDLPLVVLSRGTWDAMPGLTEKENRQAQQVWNEMQVELLNLSSNSRQVIAEKSEHFIQLQQPQLVIAAILQTIQEIK